MQDWVLTWVRGARDVIERKGRRGSIDSFRRDQSWKCHQRNDDSTLMKHLDQFGHRNEPDKPDNIEHCPSEATGVHNPGLRLDIHRRAREEARHSGAVIDVGASKVDFPWFREHSVPMIGLPLVS